MKRSFVGHRSWGACAAAAVLSLLVLSTSAPAIAAEDDPLERGTRIVGGTGAPEGQFPFMASIQMNGQHFCGGTLITPTTVMTAAHCAKDVDPAKLKVVVGRTVLSDASHGEEREVSGILVHPRFDWDLTKKSGYDLALLKLDRPVTDIQPVTLPTEGTDAFLLPGTTATVIGWGNTNPKNPDYPDRLRQVDVPILSAAECKINPAGINPDTDICAGVAGKSSCQGDSGGPLFKVFDGTVYQIGIVSRGVGCALQGAPTVYTSTSSKALWDTLFNQQAR
ncbi:serine protease [Leifsonia sp. ZF2019]|uniref:S1 family peptidase n=1 Tax=Leifsonia sp. ZF2019 TaxID=2781978 RepID=UPI001CBB4167|nr:serine protease [Leifsonia sp. ZF2019]UAJ80107.1 serine protease [Leifsonia sp. ZF2019]